MLNSLASGRGRLCKVRPNEGNLTPKVPSQQLIVQDCCRENGHIVSEKAHDLPHGGVWPSDRRCLEDIERSVLEGERDDVLDSLKGVSQMIPSKTFGDDNFDSAEIISGVPIALR